MARARFATAVIRAVAAVASALAAGGGVACNRAESEAPAAERLEGPPERLELAWEERDIPGAPQAVAPVMVKQGPAPLVYLSDMAATLQVIDTSGDLILAEAAVAPRTIVLVHPQRGIVFGGQTLFAGPLPDDRRYGIYVVPRGGSFTRVGVSRPVKQLEAEEEEQTIISVPSEEAPE